MKKQTKDGDKGEGQNGNGVTEDVGWIQTATGKAFRVRAPRVADIDILDIAHALSNVCRFNGHALSFYSVAQHCAHMVAMLRAEGAPTDTLRAALLHDVDEAYLPDVPRPVKPFLWVETGEQEIIVPGPTPANECEPDPSPQRIMRPVFVRWSDFAGAIATVVAERYRLPHGYPDMPAIKAADLRMLATERRDIMAAPPAEWTALRGVRPYTETIEPCPPRIARTIFLQHFATLFPGERKPQWAGGIGSARLGSHKALSDQHTEW